MEISNNMNTMNNYQMLGTQQKPGIQPVPVEPKEPTLSNADIYEASEGNAIRKDGEITLTPQGQNNVENKQAENTAEAEAISQDKKDSQRATATDYLAHKSKQSQVEIYLSVATDSKVELGTNGDTASIIESLRDVQKQNNAVAAYATYQENQNPANAVFS